MTWKFTLILGNEPPLRELFSFSTFNKESANLVSSEFEPVHVVCEVEMDVVVGLKVIVLPLVEVKVEVEDVFVVEFEVVVEVEVEVKVDVFVDVREDVVV